MMIEFTVFASVEFCKTKETSANAPQGTGTRVVMDSILFFNEENIFQNGSNIYFKRNNRMACSTTSS